MQIVLLADHPFLISTIGELRWKEWGYPPEPDRLEDWIAITSKEAGKHNLPITWVAMDENSSAVGAVGLAEADIEECHDRSPWVVGTIMAENQRGKGIGKQLMSTLEVWAKSKGYSQLWVGTGGRAIDFYRKCGWQIFESIHRPSGEIVTILTKTL